MTTISLHDVLRNDLIVETEDDVFYSHGLDDDGDGLEADAFI